jgi:3-hydroxymyristoyl/3-hydroxydecanoyl-(acyl carrier protein) dehydratase
MQKIKIDLVVPKEHPCFAAHFPGNPIVPGALLLQWIIRNAREHFNEDFVGIKSMKFLSLVKPGDNCMLEIEKPDNLSSIKVVCLRGSEVLCKGSLMLGNHKESTF